MGFETFKIGEDAIGAGAPCWIIGEVSQTHDGSLGNAHRYIDMVADAGADAVKFQTFKTEDLVTAEAPQAAYQQKNAKAESQYAMLKKVELSEKQFVELAKYCKKKKILFLSTPFDISSARF